MAQCNMNNGVSKKYVDKGLAGKSPTNHNHDNVYIKKTDADDKFMRKSTVEVQLTNTTGTSFDVPVSGITANDSPILDIKLSGNIQEMESLEKEWAKVLNVTTKNGSLSFVLREPLSKAITVIVKGI